MQINELFKVIDSRKNELFELLSSLVKINSESFKSHGNEEEIARYLFGLCEDLGLETEIYSPLDVDGFTEHPDYMEGRGLENRYNVSAVWRGKEDKNGLMLMAHTDTVEIGDINNWNFDPLSGEIKDGKIFGRGACDDKYAIATILFIITALTQVNMFGKRISSLI